jgi:hypothetical protein
MPTNQRDYPSINKHTQDKHTQDRRCKKPAAELARSVGATGLARSVSPGQEPLSE